MKRSHFLYRFGAVALVLLLGLSGCKKEEDAPIPQSLNVLAYSGTKNIEGLFIFELCYEQDIGIWADALMKLGNSSVRYEKYYSDPNCRTQTGSLDLPYTVTVDGEKSAGWIGMNGTAVAPPAGLPATVQVSKATISFSGASGPASSKLLMYYNDKVFPPVMHFGDAKGGVAVDAQGYPESLMAEGKPQGAGPGGSLTINGSGGPVDLGGTKWLEPCTQFGQSDYVVAYMMMGEQTLRTQAHFSSAGCPLNSYVWVEAMFLTLAVQGDQVGMGWVNAQGASTAAPTGMAATVTGTRFTASAFSPDSNKDPTGTVTFKKAAFLNAAANPNVLYLGYENNAAPQLDAQGYPLKLSVDGAIRQP